jgi:hypothetical protein
VTENQQPRTRNDITTILRRITATLLALTLSTGVAKAQVDTI